ncbi:sensor histidine kinase [Jatrophihabitans sp. DSM 45814]
MTTVAATATIQPHVPWRTSSQRHPGLGDTLLALVGTAPDTAAALDQTIRLLMRDGWLAGAEWWADEHVGRPTRRRSWGDRAGAGGSPLPLGAAGTLILLDPTTDEVEAALARLVPLLHHRWMGEQLAAKASRLARENEALDDLTALVAHDVRASLLTALLDEEPEQTLIRGLALVDSILELARNVGPDRTARARDCVEQAVADLGDVEAQVISDVPSALRVPAALQLVLRMLLTNSVAAGSRQIHVWVLGDPYVGIVVDDDGVGLAAVAEYGTGSRIGLDLCRRLVDRMGATLQLEPRTVRGTRATVLLDEVPR